LLELPQTCPNSTDGDRIAARSKGPSICGIPIEAVKNGGSDVRDRPPFRGLRHPGFGRRRACGRHLAVVTVQGAALLAGRCAAPGPHRRLGCVFCLPRHADVLLIDGTGSQNMRGRCAYLCRDTGSEWVVAAGDCAAGAGLRRQLCLRGAIASSYQSPSPGVHQPRWSCSGA
jgi:hypothetical protein